MVKYPTLGYGGRSVYELCYVEYNRLCNDCMRLQWVGQCYLTEVSGSTCNITYVASTTGCMTQARHSVLSIFRCSIILRVQGNHSTSDISLS